MSRDFLDLVRRSQLVEEDQLARFLSELKERLGDDIVNDGQKLLDEMAAADLLTQWQAEKLLAGKYKGFRLGKYKLLRVLGKGGMSQVYLAEHMLMKRKVAIKVLPRNRVADSSYLERFRIEARAAAKLDDPNIVRAYDIDQDGDTHYIVMEYVEGRDLHILVRDEGPLPYDRAADYIAQVARGLEHAHQMGLVHRDIKPANCLLDLNETVKLLDMGLARLIDDEASLTMDNNENVLGTADYLAPEQALNSHQADHRADIYSLGCTLYFLLTGHPPFPDGTISERLLKHQVEKPPSIFKDRSDAPPTLVNICNRMMAKKPEDRYDSAGEVAERLAEWLADRGFEVGGSGKRTNGSDGIGSDVFRRFAASMSRGSGSSAGSGPPPSAARKKTSTATVATVRSDDDEEIGLAPLEEDERSKKSESRESKKDTAPIAADESSKSLDSDVKTEEQPASSSPRRSLIDEELEAELARNPRPRPKPASDFNPLHPPGYARPNEGLPTWAIVSIGLAVAVAVIGVVVMLIA